MKLFYFLLIGLLFSMRGIAQTDSIAAVPADSAVNKASFTLGTSYSNNANYYGQKSIESTPYAAVAATYKFKCGLNFTGLAYKLLHDSTHSVSAASAGAGFDLKLGKHLSANFSYSHTFYPAYSPLLQAGNPDNASASLLLENWLSSKVNLDYAFGKTSDYFVTAGTGKQVTLGHISSKDLITITPAADVVAGTQHFYQTYLTQEKLRDSLQQALLGLLTGQPSTGSSTTKTTVSTQFNLLSYNFKCPLAYNRAHYMVELAYQLSVLSNNAQSNAGKANQFISASFYYQF